MKNDDKTMAQRYRDWKLFGLGVVAGVLLLWAGVGVKAGKLSGVGERITAVKNALTVEPTTTQPVVQP